MTHGRDGFSLAHRAALIVAALAAVVVMASTSYAIDDSVIVTNQGGLLAGTVSTFTANGHKAKNQKPSAVISNADISFFGSAVPAMDVLTGVEINPTNGPGVFNASYVLSNLSLLGGPDVMSAFAPGATGASTAVAGTITFAEAGVPIVPFSMPQDLAFAITPSTGGAPGTDVAVGDVFVSNYSGGETGSVIHFPPDVGTALNPLGLIDDPFPPIPVPPVQIPALVLEDSVFDAMTNPFGCVAPASTDLLGPVGVKLDADNNIWVSNSGFRGAFPSYITEYPPGAFGCTPPINLIGLGTLVSAGYLAIDADGDLWVTDLSQRAVFEFSSAGVILATIEGKKTGLKSPMGISLGAEPSPNVYVADEQAGGIFEYEDAEDGGLLNIKTAARIQGKKTKINQPVGVAVLP